MKHEGQYKVWSIEICEASNLELKGNSPTMPRSHTLENSHTPHSHKSFPTTTKIYDGGTQEAYNRSTPFGHSNFKGAVVDTFVYHKHCKFRGPCHMP